MKTSFKYSLSGILALLCLSLTSLPLSAASLYWDGVTPASWSAVGNWSTVPNATTPAPAAVPGPADDVFFNITTVNGAEAITLDANQSAHSLTFSNTATSTLTANATGTTTRVLTNGVGGLFVDAAAGAVTLGATASTLGVLQFVIGANESWINNSALTINAYGIGALVLSNTLTFDGAGSTTITGQGSSQSIFSGGGGITKTGAGTLTLGNIYSNNRCTILGTATGPFIMQAGTLTISPSLYFDLGLGGTAGVFAQANYTQTGGMAAYTIASKGMYICNWSAGTNTATFNLSGGSFSSSSEVYVGRQSTAGTCTGYLNIGGGGGSATFTGPTFSFGISGGVAGTTGNILIATNGTLVANSITLGSGYGYLFFDGGTLQAGSSAASTLIANVLTAAQIKNGGAIIDDNGKTLTIAQGFANYPGQVGSLTKINTGKLTLSGANTYSGNTTIMNGTLALSGLGTLGNGAALTLGGGTLDLGGLNPSVSAVSITNAAASGNTIQNGTLTATAYAASLTSGNAIVSANLAGSGAGLTLNGNGGTLTLSGANTYTGTTLISAGTLALSGTGTLGNGAALTLGGGTLDLGGLSPAVGAVSITSAAASGNTIQNGSLTGTSYSVNLASGNAIVTANLGGSGAGLSLTGNGLLTLSGANTYTGNTTINSGTLALGGSLSGSSSVNLAAGATFDVSAVAPYSWGAGARLLASGTASAAATLVSGAAGVTLGSSPATLTFTPTTFTGDASHPALRISGGILNLGTSSMVVNNNGGSSLRAGNYTLVTGISGGSVTGNPILDTTGGVGSGAGMGSGTVASLQVSGGQLILNVSGKPVTTTTISLNAPWTSSSTYGDALSFHVTVTGTASPGGTVTVKDGGSSGTVVGTGTLSGGAADITLNPLNSLAAGTHPNLVAAYGGDANNASSVSAPLPSQTVAQKNLTISGASAQSKMYDGTTTATIAGTLSPVVGGDVVTLNLTGTFANSGVGTGMVVTATCTLGGAAATNYTLTQPTGLMASILAMAVWNNPAGGLWDTAANWQSSVIGTGSGNTADFSQLDITTDTTVDLNSTWTIGNLVFGNTDSHPAANWILDDNGVLGNTLTLAGSTPKVTVNALGNGQSATISAIVAGSSGLAKSGSGTLVLSGANTFTGGTTVGSNSGILEARVNTTEDGLSSGAVSVGPGSTLQLDDANLSGSVSINNNISGSGLVKLVFAAGTSARNTYLPNVTGFNGALELANNGSTGDKFNAGGLNAPNTVLQIDSGSQLFVSSAASFASIALVGTGNTEGRGAMRIDGALGGSLTLLGDTTIGGESAAANLGGNITGTATNGSIYTLTQGTGNSTAGCILSGSISDGPNGGQLALTQTKGTLTLSGVNTYSGDTTVSGSTLTLKNGLALQHSVLTLAGSTVNVDPTVTNLTLGGISSLTDNLTLPGTVTVLTLQPTTNQMPAYAGTLDGSAMTLTKTGPGTQVFSGMNYYSGSTTISNGVLVGVVGGSCANSLITVESGATLGVQVSSPGSQWTGSGLTLNGAAPFLSFDLAGNEPSTSVAPLQVNGNLALGNVQLVVSNGTLTVGAVYPLIAYTGTCSGTLPSGAALILPSSVSGVLSNDVANAQTIYLIVGPAQVAAPVIHSPGLAGTNLVFSTDNTVIGSNYVLLSSPNLQPPVTWTPVSTNAGTGSPITNQVPVNPALPQRFFRYQVQ